MKKESKVNQAKYVELNLFPEEKEEHQKDSISSENMESDTSPDKEYDLTDLFERLSKSTFRSRFHLSKKDKEYIAEKGLATIRKHAEDFVAKRLAPAVIPNDGKQTPMRGHPVFIAQHATGCCCRGCFFKWHHIPAGRQLTGEEQQYAVAVLMAWIEKQVLKSMKFYFMSKTLLRQWVASCPRTLGKYAYPTCESCQNHILDIAFLQEN